MLRASSILRAASANAFTAKATIIFFILAKQLKFLAAYRADLPGLKCQDKGL